jgi:hypothetical protein
MNRPLSAPPEGNCPEKWNFLLMARPSSPGKRSLSHKGNNWRAQFAPTRLFGPVHHSPLCKSHVATRNPSLLGAEPRSGEGGKKTGQILWHGHLAHAHHGRDAPGTPPQLAAATPVDGPRCTVPTPALGLTATRSSFWLTGEPSGPILSCDSSPSQCNRETNPRSRDPHAEVAELADALRSGRSERKLVGVQIPPSAFLL